MMWLSWRQARAQTATLYAAVAACAAVLAVTGPRLPRSGAGIFDLLTPGDRRLYFTGLIVVAVAPALVGAFLGAPMVARELENGTHRLAWSQGVTRTRWLAVRLGLTALAAAAAVGVLTLAVTWWAAPLDGAASESRGSLPSRLTPVSFAMRGITPVAYTVFALVLGVAIGIVLRRSIAALALTLALFTFVQIAMPLWVRPHLIPPTTQVTTISEDTIDGIGYHDSDPVPTLEVRGPAGAWVLSDRTVDASGRAVPVPASFVDCDPGPPRPDQRVTEVRPRLETCLTQLSAAGYRQQLVYQPASRFWPLQWAETGVFLALSGLLAWFSFWRLRRV
ncbi:MAG TPA: ABC transporter permease subunit [Mycobacteriales bacterium]|nr:ABC transporter permease subunit [Mycobacteriales bacterium]